MTLPVKFERKQRHANPDKKNGIFIVFQHIMTLMSDITDNKT